ncbi:MAG: PH domain-containing protein [Armatimonadetes bacterium]|nr:PH domain-containing protein [Armatimonadota bacterium]
MSGANCEPQRFPDRHGWLRNRRAVVLDEDGVTVERWIGRPLHIPWGDVTAVHWDGADTLVVQAGLRQVRIERGVAGMSGLGQAINQAMLARTEDDGHLLIEPADVERWLAGFRVAVVAEGPVEDSPSSADLASWAALLAVVSLGWLLAQSASLPWNPWLLALAPMAAGAALCARLSAYVAARRRRPACRVAAGPSGVEVQRRGQLPVTFAWGQVERIDSGPLRHDVRLSGGRVVHLPAAAAFEPLVGALRTVVAHRAGFHAAAPPVPAAALSPAGQPALAVGALRGVSRATPGSRPAQGGAQFDAGDESGIPWIPIVGLSAILVAGAVAYATLTAYLLTAVSLGVAALAVIDQLAEAARQERRNDPPNAMVLGGRVMLRDTSGQEAVFGWDDVAGVAETSAGHRVELVGGRVIEVNHGAEVEPVVSALRMAVDGRTHFETAEADEQETLDA